MLYLLDVLKTVQNSLSMAEKSSLRADRKEPLFVPSIGLCRLLSRITTQSKDGAKVHPVPAGVLYHHDCFSTFKMMKSNFSTLLYANF